MYLSALGIFGSSSEFGYISGFTGFDQQRERIVVVFGGTPDVEMWIEEFKLKFVRYYEAELHHLHFVKYHE